MTESNEQCYYSRTKRTVNKKLFCISIYRKLQNIQQSPEVANLVISYKSLVLIINFRSIRIYCCVSCSLELYEKFFSFLKMVQFSIQITINARIEMELTEQMKIVFEMSHCSSVKHASQHLPAGGDT